MLLPLYSPRSQYRHVL
jgi:hypothetical protein